MNLCLCVSGSVHTGACLCATVCGGVQSAIRTCRQRNPAETATASRSFAESRSRQPGCTMPGRVSSRRAAVRARVQRHQDLLQSRDRDSRAARCQVGSAQGAQLYVHECKRSSAQAGYRSPTHSSAKIGWTLTISAIKKSATCRSAAIRGCHTELCAVQSISAT